MTLSQVTNTRDTQPKKLGQVTNCIKPNDFKPNGIKPSDHLPNIAPEGTLQRLLFLNGGGTLQTQGHQQKTMSARRSVLVLFLIFNINLLV